MKLGHIITLLSFISLLTSCSWYKDVERNLVDGDEEDNKKNQTVSRAEYDRLLLKYEEVSKKYEKLKETNPLGESDIGVSSSLKVDKDVLSDLETVDVFKEAQSAKTPAPKISKDLNSQVILFRKGVGLKQTAPGEATKIFQQLESQGHSLIKIHAKYELGDLLFQKSQFDLSLQIFEDIISNHATSGVVLMALNKAYVCSEKLGAQDKKDQYGSMLNDVFEAN